jgi:signal transduction histidine kinase
MPGGGHIQISLEEFPDHLLLTFGDNGPGIPDSALKAIFCPGYSTHVDLHPEPERAGASHFGSASAPHRGLGLSIVHAIVNSAGGSVRAENCRAEGTDREEKRGASFLLQFPLKPPLAT